jgi:hypothetical protein
MALRNVTELGGDCSALPLAAEPEESAEGCSLRAGKATPELFAPLLLLLLRRRRRLS